MIELENYSKSFGHTPVLKIDYFCFDKSWYWLRGKNGSGKSTLMKSIAALLTFEGEIRIDQLSIHKKPQEYRRWVGFGYAEPLFPSFLTGSDLISFFQKSKGQIPGQLDKLVEALGAGYFLAQKVDTYSSGMLKKLSLLLAFIGSPRWVLLDEPFNALDLDAARGLKVLMKEVHKQEGVHFIFSSHPQTLVLTMEGLTTVDIENRTIL